MWKIFEYVHKYSGNPDAFKRVLIWEARRSGVVLGKRGDGVAFLVCRTITVSCRIAYAWREVLECIHDQDSPHRVKPTF